MGQDYNIIDSTHPAIILQSLEVKTMILSLPARKITNFPSRRSSGDARYWTSAIGRLLTYRPRDAMSVRDTAVDAQLLADGYCKMRADWQFEETKPCLAANFANGKLRSSSLGNWTRRGSLLKDDIISWVLRSEYSEPKSSFVMTLAFERFDSVYVFMSSGSGDGVRDCKTHFGGPFPWLQTQVGAEPIVFRVLSKRVISKQREQKTEENSNSRYAPPWLEWFLRGASKWIDIGISAHLHLQPWGNTGMMYELVLYIESVSGYELDRSQKRWLNRGPTRLHFQRFCRISLP